MAGEDTPDVYRRKLGDTVIGIWKEVLSSLGADASGNKYVSQNIHGKGYGPRYETPEKKPRTGGFEPGSSSGEEECQAKCGRPDCTTGET